MLTRTKPAIQSSIGRYGHWGGARLVNCFAEKGDGDQRDLFMVMAIPGLNEFCDIGATPRGVHVMGEVLYIVAGANLYSVDSSGTATSVGSVPG